MNLIEQLGGYEKANGYLHELYKIPMHEQTEDTVTWLPLLLLEYRREHNIFEIDDYVVNERPNTIEAVFQVETLTPKLKKPKTLRCGRWGNYPVGCNSVRHATDAEIEAGHRL